MIRKSIVVALLFTAVACEKGNQQQPPTTGGAATQQSGSSAAVTASTPAAAISPATLPSSNVVLVTGNAVTSFDPSGEVTWTFPLPAGDSLVSPPVAALSSMVYLRGQQNVYAITPEGKLAWQAKAEPAGSLPSMITMGDSTVSISSDDKALVNFDDAGKERWRFPLPEGDTITAAPVVSPGSMIFLRGRSTLYAVDPQGLLTWEKDLTAK